MKSEASTLNSGALQKIEGDGWLHESSFGDLIRKHFPDATQLDLYGAGVTFNSETGEVVSISCQGLSVNFSKSNQTTRG